MQGQGGSACAGPCGRSLSVLCVSSSTSGCAGIVGLAESSAFKALSLKNTFLLRCMFHLVKCADGVWCGLGEFSSRVRDNLVTVTANLSIAPGSPLWPHVALLSQKCQHAACTPGDWLLHSRRMSAPGFTVWTVHQELFLYSVEWSASPVARRTHLGCVHDWLLRMTPLTAFACRPFVEVCSHCVKRSPAQRPVSAPAVPSPWSGMVASAHDSDRVSLMTSEIRAISCTYWVSVCPFCCPFAHLSFGLCAFFSLVCRNSLYILDASLFLDVCFASIFSYPMVCLVTFFLF